MVFRIVSTSPFFWLWILLGLTPSLIPNSNAYAADAYPDWGIGKLVGKNGNMAYRLFKPKTIEKGHVYPLVIFMHGSGEHGTDNVSQLNTPGPIVWSLAENQKNYPCFVVAPQANGPAWYAGRTRDDHAHLTGLEGPATSTMMTLLELIDSLAIENPIDAQRLYCTGLSEGGIGTWEINLRYPHKFAAMIPVCGVGEPTKANLLAQKPIWAFHGDADANVNIGGDRDMIAAIQAAGGKPKFTVYPGVGHNSWDRAYSDPNLVAWTFSQKLEGGSQNPPTLVFQTTRNNSPLSTLLSLDYLGTHLAGRIFFTRNQSVKQYDIKGSLTQRP